MSADPLSKPALKLRPSRAFLNALKRHSVRPTRYALSVSVARQRMALFEAKSSSAHGTPAYEFRREFVISTSRFGIGQVMNSNCTPLGLHRVAKKVGGGQPVGTVFKARQPVGLAWDGMPEGSIVHRILWLEGLEPSFNRGGDVDTFRRYIYIHGFGDETTLGRPQSHGCIHLSAADLIPLYNKLPKGTLVWIAKQ
jgi:L,D-transpeptidase catalytic domain